MNLDTHQPTSVTQKLDTFSYEQLFRFKRNDKKEPYARPIQIDNEYNEPPRVKVDVQEPIVLAVEEKGELRQQDLTADVQRDFDYLSGTRGLELNSMRTEIIQTYIDTMVQGSEWEGKARIVIMNKGIEPDAFAMPDGSIFISQSLINMFSSLDEIIAVVAHEVRHLLKGTTKARYLSKVKRGIDKGVQWIHEMSSDFGSPELIEKVGLKTTAEAEAFSKLAVRFGNRRGIEHQAPVIRAVQQLAIHAAKDFETSHIEFTPMPRSLRAKEIPTNMELLMDAIEHDDSDSARLYLENLYPTDLYSALETINSYRSWSLRADRNVELAKIIGQIIVSRLREHGYDEQQIKLLFLKLADTQSLLYPDFKNLSEITQLIPIADEMDTKDELATVGNLLFLTPILSDLVYQVNSLVRDRFYSFTKSEPVEFIHSDEVLDYVESVQNVINRIKNTNPAEYSSYNFLASTLNSSQWKVVYDYITSFYIPNAQDGEVDETQIEELFTQLHTIGVNPIRNYPLDSRMLGFGKKNAEVISRTFERVFQIPFFEDASPYIDDLQPLDDLKNEIAGTGWSNIQASISREAYKNGVTEEHLRQLVELAMHELDHDSAFVEDYSSVVSDLLYAKTNKSRSYRFASGLAGKDNSAKLRYWQEAAQENNLLDDPQYQEVLEHIKIERIRVKVLVITDVLSRYEGLMFEELEKATKDSGSILDGVQPFELIRVAAPVFMLSSAENTNAKNPYQISDYDALYNLLPIKLLHEKIQVVETQSLSELEAAFKKMCSEFSVRYAVNDARLFDDNPLTIIIAEPFRRKLLQLIENRAYSKSDYPLLITLLKENFPKSNQSAE